MFTNVTEDVDNNYIKNGVFNMEDGTWFNELSETKENKLQKSNSTTFSEI